MLTPRSFRSTLVVLVILTSLAHVAAQQHVVGQVDAGAFSVPADVVAEARLALAWFPLELGRGSLDADGAFVVRFHDPLPLPQYAGMPAERLFAGVHCDALELSDPAASVVLVRDLRVIPRGAPCEYCETLGRIYLASRPHGAHARLGDLEVQWLFADRPLRVEGVCTYGWGSERYALDLHPGWNTLVLETIAVHPSDGYCDCHDVLVTNSGAQPSGTAWHTATQR